jgi:hypothetical protein
MPKRPPWTAHHALGYVIILVYRSIFSTANTIGEGKMTGSRLFNILGIVTGIGTMALLAQVVVPDPCIERSKTTTGSPMVRQESVIVAADSRDQSVLSAAVFCPIAASPDASENSHDTLLNDQLVTKGLVQPAAIKVNDIVDLLTQSSPPASLSTNAHFLSSDFAEGSQDGEDYIVINSLPRNGSSEGGTSSNHLAGSASGGTGLGFYGGDSSSGKISTKPTSSDGTKPGTGMADATQKPARRTGLAKPAQMVLWCYIGRLDSPQSLRTAISSGLITHVVFALGNRQTSDTLNWDSTQEALQIARDARVRIILTRFVWPSAPGILDTEHMFTPDHYVREIQEVRREAKEIGADFTGFDMEPYGDTPLADYIKGYGATEGDLDNLNTVMDRVIAQAGKVDFLYPAGSFQPESPYNILSRLGTYRITQSTYYNIDRAIRNVPHPYEIFAAYVNTTTVNTRQPTHPYFLIHEVFENSHYWSNREGILLYHKEDRADEVARALSEYGGNFVEEGIW